MARQPNRKTRQLMNKKPQLWINGKRTKIVPECPYCQSAMELGRGGAEPQYYWAGCDPCGLYQTARTEEELADKISSRRS